MTTIETSNQKCPDVKHKALVGIHYKSDKEFKSPTVFEAEWPMHICKVGEDIDISSTEMLKFENVDKIVITVCE